MGFFPPFLKLKMAQVFEVISVDKKDLFILHTQ